MKPKTIRVRALSLFLAIVLLFSTTPIHPSLAYGLLYEVNNVQDFLRYVQDSHDGKTFEGEAIQLNVDINLKDPVTIDGVEYSDSYEYMSSKYPELKSITFGSDKAPFMGTFDGCGHTITGLSYEISSTSTSAASNTGLFGVTQNAEIKNFIIESANIGADYRGGIIASFAQNTRFENISVRNSDLRLYCYNVVVTLGSDGGMNGGALIGKAKDCVLYNCETKNTNVRSNMTSGVEAASGKGMYMGGLVGDADATTIEYCRVQGGKVDLQYDVAVAALGGFTGYVGGIVGEMQAGTKVIDCFSTSELYFYTATYVAVGAGNTGHAGGIAAAVWGSSCEITRSHYAGKMSSRQINSILILPVIIQNDANLSGIAKKFSGGSVQDSYFKQSVTGDVLTLGNDNVTDEYGPQNDETYIDRLFWESHDYDFTGTTLRSSTYGNLDHVNKWVMDYSNGYPVHGDSVGATFTFPGAGSLSIAPTELIGSSISSSNPLQPASQGIHPFEHTVDIQMELNENYRLNSWYRYSGFKGTGFSDYESLFSVLKNSESLNRTDVDLNSQACNDSDLFIADTQALVLFHNIYGKPINALTGAEDAYIGDDWYDYLAELPNVVPTDKPISANATLVGWTTVPGGYEAVTTAQLAELKQTGAFYTAGDQVEKAMHLYPVYADLISNVTVAIEGHAPDAPGTRTDGSIKVGDAVVATDEQGRIYVELTNVASVDQGYRFLGWYTNCGNDSPAYTGGTRVGFDNDADASNGYRYYLDEYDLTQPHTFVAKFEYRVDYYSQVKDWAFNQGVVDELYTSRWHVYNQTFIEVGAPMDGQDTFRHWGYERWTKTSECDCSQNEIVNGKSITKPLNVYAHQSGSSLFDIAFESDFPGSGTIQHSLTGALGSGKLKLTMTPNPGYRFVAWVGERKSSTAQKIVETEPTYTRSGLGGSYFKFNAHMDAQINFIAKDGSIKTVYRRYEEKIFSDVVQTYQYTFPFRDNNVTATIEGKDVINGVHHSYPSPGIQDSAYYVDGYYFLGWISDAEVSGDEQDYIYDAGDYCTSDANRALPYLMDGTELCYETQNIYPVYARYQIETTTNVKEQGVIENAGVNIPADPTYKPVSYAGEALVCSDFSQSDGYMNDPNGTVNIIVTAEHDRTFVVGSDGETYKLTSITVSKDHGSPVTLTSVGEDGSIATSVEYMIEPGHSYLFTANYEPLVLVYHTSANDIVTVVRDRGTLVGEQPDPVPVNGYVMRGWTESRPNGDAWFNTDQDALHVTSGVVVGHPMELWPNFVAVNISVNSNIDNELGSTNHRRWYNTQDSLSAVTLEATDVSGYAFQGWYTDYQDSENWGTLVSPAHSFILQGDVPYSGALYTAVYVNVYTIYYHALDGSVIYTDRIAKNEPTPFIREETDDNGNPVDVVVNGAPFSEITQTLDKNQQFEQWRWANGETWVEWDDFKSLMVGEDIQQDMHLYPVVWDMSAWIDGAPNYSEEYNDLWLGFVSDDEGNISWENVSAYVPITYNHPMLTIHIEKLYGQSTTPPVSVSQPDISVKLHMDSGNGWVPEDVEQTDTNGDAVFFFHGYLTLVKTGSANQGMAGQTALFEVENQDTSEKQIVSVTCGETADENNNVSGSLVLRLPMGTYRVTEKSGWLWNYIPTYRVQRDGKTSDVVNESVSVTLTHVDTTVICENTHGVAKNNWLTDTDRKTNDFS